MRAEDIRQGKKAREEKKLQPTQEISEQEIIEFSENKPLICTKIYGNMMERKGEGFQKNAVKLT